MLEHQSEFQVRGYEMDSFGHVNNAVYFHYIEQERWEFFQKHHFFSVDSQGNRIFANQLRLIPIELKIRYLRELVVFDEVTVKAVYRCVDDFVQCDYVIRKKDGKKAATASSKLLFTDENRIVHDIPDDFRELVGE